MHSNCYPRITIHTTQSDPVNDAVVNTAKRRATDAAKLHPEALLADIRTQQVFAR